MNWAKFVSAVVRTRPRPNDLAAEVARTKDGIEQQLQIVAGRRVAMEVEVDEVDRFVGELAVLAEPGEVIAEVEEVGWDVRGHRAGL